MIPGQTYSIYTLFYLKLSPCDFMVKMFEVSLKFLFDLIMEKV
jgi:hypothetical protein